MAFARKLVEAVIFQRSSPCQLVRIIHTTWSWKCVSKKHITNKSNFKTMQYFVWPWCCPHGSQRMEGDLLRSKSKICIYLASDRSSAQTIAKQLSCGRKCYGNKESQCAWMRAVTRQPFSVWGSRRAGRTSTKVTLECVHSRTHNHTLWNTYSFQFAFSITCACRSAI